MKAREEESCMTDIEIEFMNKKRHIEFELTPEEILLYTYSRDVTGQKLEELHEKYIELKKIGEKEEEEEKEEDGLGMKKRKGLVAMPDFGDEIVEENEENEDLGSPMPVLVRR